MIQAETLVTEASTPTPSFLRGGEPLLLEDLDDGPPYNGDKFQQFNLNNLDK